MTCVAWLRTLQREGKGRQAWSREGSPHCSETLRWPWSKGTATHPHSITGKGFPSVSAAPSNPQLGLVPREQAPSACP